VVALRRGAEQLHATRLFDRRGIDDQPSPTTPARCGGPTSISSSDWTLKRFRRLTRKVAAQGDNKLQPLPISMSV
jgi:hypothetical protein